jgi:hypothetical protein
VAASVEQEHQDDEGHRNLFHQGFWTAGVGRLQREGCCQDGTGWVCSVCRSKKYTGSRRTCVRAFRRIITFSKVSRSGNSGLDYWRRGFPLQVQAFTQVFL